MRTASLPRQHGVRFIKQGVTRDNYRELLVPLLTAGGGQGFCVNLSVDTSSVDIMTLCREIGALYIDTVVEPWAGFYFDKKISPESRSNYALRETLLAAKHKSPGGPTAVSTCGANPGMVSWFVKQALLDIARDTNTPFNEPKSREGWGQLAHKLGVKGIHIAERDTQRSKNPKPMDVFVNTWSVEGFVSEGMQPAELGWGTHEKWMPENGRTHADRLWCCDLSAAARRQHPRALLVPDAGRAIRLPGHPQRVDLDRGLFHRARRARTSIYRPTCHYAYHPANDAVLSLHEIFGATGKMQQKWHILDENEIVDGIDELGVLVYGHAKNAYWYGSQLSIEETRQIAPYQNATGMQVSSAVLAGMVWALENPTAGIVEADEMDFRRCLEIQMPYLGPVKGFYTDWTPLTDRPGLFPGGHRHVGSLAVQERAGALTPRSRRRSPRYGAKSLRKPSHTSNLATTNIGPIKVWDRSSTKAGRRRSKTE